MTKTRCAIYTRKSTDEGLDQSFNSLDAQREACEAYITSQRHEGWRALPAHYDDGGHSGGTIERPALKRLLEDVDSGRVDMVVVYKIDRLTRSLSDFAKLVDRLEAANASFVSVTQQFNTSTSMGRLTLNVLLSFAQFEREVTAERIRDKIAASKKKGMWMGGFVPLGYDKTDAGLVINPGEADTVRRLFEAYLELKCVRRLKAFSDQKGLKTKHHTFSTGRTLGGVQLSRGRLYHLLSNPLYIGQIRHGANTYDGLHDAVIDQPLWDAVQTQLERNRVSRRTRRNAAHPSPLAGKLFTSDDVKLTPTHANKDGRRFRYYVTAPDAGAFRLPAVDLEAAVLNGLLDDRQIALHFERHGEDKPKPTEVFGLLEKVVIQDDVLCLSVSRPGTKRVRSINIPFSIRRRGVEQKIVLNGVAEGKPDKVLIRRILRSLEWLDQIKAGRSLAEIGRSESVRSEYVGANIDLALLGPEVLKNIAAGKQNPAITAARCAVTKLPVIWQDQKPIFLE